MKKILIAVPTFENIYPDTFKSIYDLDKGDNEVIFNFVRGYDCATARNNIILEAKRIKADYVLMVDNDMVIPPFTLTCFLNNPMLINLGYAVQRTASTTNEKINIFKFGERDYTPELQYTPDEMKELIKNNISRIQIHGGGMACAFIDMKVFDIIPFPWFDWVNYDNNTHLSEDLFFCEQCHKYNIPIYVDTRVNCGHLIRYIQY